GLASPGCAHPAARAAGPATVLRQRYLADGAAHHCYDGALVTAETRGTRFEVVGAADPFTDERIAEAGNAELAVRLLSGHGKVAWLDLHRPEQPPEPTRDAPPGGEDGDVPYTPAPGEGTETGDGGERPGGEETGDGEGSGTGNGDGSPAPGGADAETGEPNPLLTAFPPWLWAVLLQLLLAALLYALWRARRLGAPVTEPLPVLVRSAETVEGRARLYQRVHARRTAMTALRTGALRRLAPVLDLPPDPSEDTVVAQVAARSGWPADRVREVLYGPRPPDDETLVWRAGALDALVTAVLDPNQKGTPS
ncbi:MAG: hypothetical protein ACRDT6_15945, partial [Micromonosporaceae bacterium]